MMKNKLLNTAFALLLAAVFGGICLMVVYGDPAQGASASQTIPTPAHSQQAQATALPVEGGLFRLRLPAQQPLEESTIVLSCDSLYQSVGEQSQLVVLWSEEGAQLSWHSMDPSVATVENGLVKSQQAGKTTVFCTDGKSIAYCNVKVVEVLRCVTNWKTLEVGEQWTPCYEYTGTGPLYMCSMFPDIVSLKDGVCTALAPGRGVISCTDGIVTTQIVITVKESSQTA